MIALQLLPTHDLVRALALLWMIGGPFIILSVLENEK